MNAAYQHQPVNRLHSRLKHQVSAERTTQNEMTKTEQYLPFALPDIGDEKIPRRQPRRCVPDGSRPAHGLRRWKRSSPPTSEAKCRPSRSTRQQAGLHLVLEVELAENRPFADEAGRRHARRRGARPARTLQRPPRSSPTSRRRSTLHSLRDGDDFFCSLSVTVPGSLVRMAEARRC